MENSFSVLKIIHMFINNKKDWITTIIYRIPDNLIKVQLREISNINFYNKAI